MSNMLLFHNCLSQAVLYLNCQLSTTLRQGQQMYFYFGPQIPYSVPEYPFVTSVSLQAGEYEKAVKLKCG
jgi:hypothetical protein